MFHPQANLYSVPVAHSLYTYPMAVPVPFIVIPTFFYPISYPVYYYPVEPVMEMNDHQDIPSVQKYPPAAGFCPSEGNTCAGVYDPTPQPPQHTQEYWPKSECTPIRITDPSDGSQVVTMEELVQPKAMSPVTSLACEGEGEQDGMNHTSPAPATDVRTLDENVAPILTPPPESKPETPQASNLPCEQNNKADSDAPLSSPHENPAPSTPPSPVALTWGEKVDIMDPLPSIPPVFETKEGEEFENARMENIERQKKEVEEVLKRNEKVEEVMKREETVEVVMKQKDEYQEEVGQKEQTEEQEEKAMLKGSEMPEKQTVDEQRLHAKTSSVTAGKGVELFIKCLPDTVDDQSLYNMFLPFGVIHRAKVIMENGRSKGFGYITYATATEATTAIKEMNGKLVGRRPLYIVLSKPREEQRPYYAPREQRTGRSRQADI